MKEYNVFEAGKCYISQNGTVYECTDVAADAVVCGAKSYLKRGGPMVGLDEYMTVENGTTVEAFPVSKNQVESNPRCVGALLYLLLRLDYIREGCLLQSEDENVKKIKEDIDALSEKLHEYFK